MFSVPIEAFTLIPPLNHIAADLLMTILTNHTMAISVAKLMMISKLMKKAAITSIISPSKQIEFVFTS